MSRDLRNARTDYGWSRPRKIYYGKENTTGGCKATLQPHKCI